MYGWTGLWFVTLNTISNIVANTVLSIHLVICPQRSPEWLPHMRLQDVITWRTNLRVIATKTENSIPVIQPDLNSIFHCTSFLTCFVNSFPKQFDIYSLTDESKNGSRKRNLHHVPPDVRTFTSVTFDKAGNGSQKLYIQCAPEISAVNWRMSAMAQNN
jgi:hypothetical protein